MISPNEKNHDLHHFVFQKLKYEYDLHSAGWGRWSRWQPWIRIQRSCAGSRNVHPYLHQTPMNSLLFSSIARLFDGMHTGCQYRLLWLTVPTWTLYHCAYWRCIKTRLYICYHNGIRKRSLHYIAILWLSNPITSNPLPCLNLRALWSIERISGIWSRDAILICSLTGYGWHQSNIYFFL